MENKYGAGKRKKLDRKGNNATYHALRINTRHRKQAYQSNGETAREMRGKDRLVHRFVPTAAFPATKVRRAANSPRSNRSFRLSTTDTNFLFRGEKNPIHFSTIRVSHVKMLKFFLFFPRAETRVIRFHPSCTTSEFHFTINF